MFTNKDLVNIGQVSLYVANFVKVDPAFFAPALYIDRYFIKITILQGRYFARDGNLTF